MPKEKIDYSKSFIYRLCCLDVNIKEIYVGSTTNMRNRKYRHKSDCNNEKQKKYYLYVYQFIRENGGFDNWEMILVENYDAKDNLELRKRERYWKDELKATLNSCNPYKTAEDESARKKIYHKKNKIIINKKKREFRNDNKEYIAKQRSELRKKNLSKHLERFNCECGGKYKKEGKHHHLKTDKHQKWLEN
jgi:hypothetical protein